MHLRDVLHPTCARMTALLLALLLPACGDEPLGPSPAGENDAVLAGMIGQRVTVNMENRAGILGNSLPGNWRPFVSTSPWNTPIPSNAQKHPDSDQIIAHMASKAATLAFSRSYIPPVWVVDSSQMDPVIVRSDRIFDWWDMDRDGWSDVGVPLAESMWPEATVDGHIIIIDPARNVAWEMSRFQWIDHVPHCTTFNIWALTGSGVGNPNEGDRWGTRGGRGSGFPIIAGLLRPEELGSDRIRHALTFTFSEIRMGDDGSNMFIHPPACRSDGDVIGSQYPVAGMRFQLDPAATDADFAAWGLTEEARMVARTLQNYGMFLGDRGGDMKIQVQLLSENASRHRAEWDLAAPGLYRAIEKIPTNRLRVVYTGDAILKAD